MPHPANSGLCFTYKWVFFPFLLISSWCFKPEPKITSWGVLQPQIKHWVKGLQFQLGECAGLYKKTDTQKFSQFWQTICPTFVNLSHLLSTFAIFCQLLVQFSQLLWAVVNFGDCYCPFQCNWLWVKKGAWVCFAPGNISTRASKLKLWNKSLSWGCVRCSSMQPASSSTTRSRRRCQTASGLTSWLSKRIMSQSWLWRRAHTAPLTNHLNDNARQDIKLMCALFVGGNLLMIAVKEGSDFIWNNCLHKMFYTRRGCQDTWNFRPGAPL